MEVSEHGKMLKSARVDKSTDTKPMPSAAAMACFLYVRYVENLLRIVGKRVDRESILTNLFEPMEKL